MKNHLLTTSNSTSPRMGGLYYLLLHISILEDSTYDYNDSVQHISNDPGGYSTSSLVVEDIHQTIILFTSMLLVFHLSFHLKILKMLVN